MVNICILFVGGEVFSCGVVWSRLQDCKEKPTPGGLYSPLPIAPMALLSYTSPTLMWPLSPYGLPTTIPMAPPGKPTQ